MEIAGKPKEKRPLTIVLRQKEAWGHVECALSSGNPPVNYTKARTETHGIRIHPIIPEDYRRVIKCLTYFKYEYHTYTLEEERQHYLVVRGLPKKMRTREIFGDIADQGLDKK